MSQPWKRPNAPLNVWTDNDLVQGIRAGERRIDAEEMGALADQRVAIQAADPMETMLADEAHQHRMDNLRRGIALLKSEQARRAILPRPIHQFAFAEAGDTSHLLFSTTHGWISGRFWPGEWTDHHEYGPQFDGPVFVLGDDLDQVEVEVHDTPEGREYLCGTITHFLPAPADPSVSEVLTLDAEGLVDLLTTGKKMRPLNWRTASLLRDGFCYVYGHTFYEHTPRTVGVEISPASAGAQEAIRKYGDQWEVVP